MAPHRLDGVILAMSGVSNVDDLASSCLRKESIYFLIWMLVFLEVCKPLCFRHQDVPGRLMLIAVHNKYPLL